MFSFTVIDTLYTIQAGLCVAHGTSSFLALFVCFFVPDIKQPTSVANVTVTLSTHQQLSTYVSIVDFYSGCNGLIWLLRPISLMWHDSIQRRTLDELVIRSRIVKEIVSVTLLLSDIWSTTSCDLEIDYASCYLVYVLESFLPEMIKYSDTSVIWNTSHHHFFSSHLLSERFWYSRRFVWIEL